MATPAFVYTRPSNARSWPRMRPSRVPGAIEILDSKEALAAGVDLAHRRAV